MLQTQDKMAFVIIRPGGLTNDPASGNGVLTESTSVAGSISRDDVAALVVKALLSKKADGKVRVCMRMFVCVCMHALLSKWEDVLVRLWAGRCMCIFCCKNDRHLRSAKPCHKVQLSAMFNLLCQPLAALATPAVLEWPQVLGHTRAKGHRRRGRLTSMLS